MRNALAHVVPLLALAALPAQNRDWPYSMDYGPYLMTTFEGGGRSGDTYKGVVVKVGDGAVAFDTELLRLSAAWTDGWLRLKGTAYDGAHGPMVRLRGRKVAEVASGPGWAKDGDFGDPRPQPFGPLPREQGRYRGLWLCGDQVVLGYTVGDMPVREQYGSAAAGRVLLRTLEFGPSAKEQLMVVADGPEGATMAKGTPGRGARLWWQPAAERVQIAATTAGFETLPMGGPSRSDSLDPARGNGATVSFVPGFARPRGAAAPVEGQAESAADAAARLLPVLHDGAAAATENDAAGSVWFERSRRGGQESDAGRYLVDLQKPAEVTRIATFSWHSGGRSIQQYDVFGSADAAADAAAQDPAAAGWQKLASVDTAPLGEGDKHGAAIADGNGLGRFQRLLFVMRSGGARLCEIDVFADQQRADLETLGMPRQNLAVGLRGDQGPRFEARGERLLLRVPPHAASVRVCLSMAQGADAAIDAVAKELWSDGAAPALAEGPSQHRWGAPLVTKGERSGDAGPFAVDTITVPLDNRFGSRMRTGAFDFFRDGTAAVSTWNGDVWLVRGIDASLERLEWQRFATGLFDPLGLRIVDDVVHVHGRDGITKLHDTDRDGEADFYECFNNDVCVTHAFHEFAFDLQTDAEGNFYCSKGGPVNPGGRGFMRIAPHHGTIMKIAKDGSRMEVVASGLRAPNGIGVSPTGVLTSGDNEGTFMPRCRINWIEAPGYYAGVKDLAHRSPVPDLPDLPLCWMPMEIDNSSGGQVWVTGAGWPDLAGRLLHLSYGTCSTYLVLTEVVDGRIQGGVVRLPANFTSSCMRGRFGPDGQLYVIGLQGWQTSAAKEGGFHRVRRTGAPLGLPVALRTCTAGVYLTFAEPLDAETAGDPSSFGVEIWNYLYSPNYGSPELSILHPERKVEQGKPNRDPLRVAAAVLSPDRRTVFLRVEGMQPVQQMKITWNVDAADGRALKGELHNTIHALATDPGFPAGK
jgi:hypothetical protein